MIPTNHIERREKAISYYVGKGIIAKIWKMRLDLARENDKISYKNILDYEKECTKKYGKEYAFFGNKICLSDLEMLKLADK